MKFIRNIFFKNLIFVVFSLIISCAQNNKSLKHEDGLLKENGKQTGQTNDYQQRGTKTQNCDEDFEIFFKKFKNDSVFQRSHVRFPLKTSYPSSDPQSDELVSELVKENQYQIIELSQDEEAWKKEFNAYKIEWEQQDHRVLYQRTGIDNGIYEAYEFHCIDGDWYLISIEDAST
ncbi:DUF4348 domain-containing protein [Flavobacteriaceae bacterium M23B6Z8]